MTKVSRGKQLYEGKAKILFEGPEPGTIIQHFKDDATAFNNEKKGTISGKGVLNNRISEFIMTKLMEIGIPTHFIRTLNMREQLVKKADIIPVEVIVRNIAAGSLCKRLGLDEGMVLPKTLVEFCYKDDDLGDPLVSEDHLLTFGWMEEIELKIIKERALRINDFLSGLFLGVGIQLVDFKMEFGRVFDQEYIDIVLADEISPDSCRLWDVKTAEKMDKDRFRRDLGNVAQAYRDVASRLGVFIDEEIDASTAGKEQETKGEKHA